MMIFKTGKNPTWLNTEASHHYQIGRIDSVFQNKWKNQEYPINKNNVPQIKINSKFNYQAKETVTNKTVWETNYHDLFFKNVNGQTITSRTLRNHSQCQFFQVSEGRLKPETRSATSARPSALCHASRVLHTTAREGGVPETSSFDKMKTWSTVKEGGQEPSQKMPPDSVIIKPPSLQLAGWGETNSFPVWSWGSGRWNTQGPPIRTTEEYPHTGTSSEILRPENYDPGYWHVVFIIGNLTPAQLISLPS